ncbi:transporter substrate-binding domain-containing protein [Paenibacillus sinopodophylli]|uniref:transporter substrate-binding domain-containing protein n=1 Tax=Paenibacillus sinopodophylli TaxID=1837342 RepID=UPI00110CBD85|nr:transporter substrate-binding domain-containing protein [Paenibacillus sinopodophylli]
MKKAFFLSTAIILALTLAGCGSNKENAGANTEAAAGNAAQEVTKIVVGTGTQFPQVAFIDESGKLTGFDVELVREIDKRLPAYEFDIQTLEFTNLLLSLETKKIDLVAHEMEKNPEREEKYLFNTEPYAHWRNKIIVAKGNDSVQSLDDLKGKKVLTTATSAQSTILENYNKENNNAIEIVYQNGGANDTVSQVTSGRVDAFLAADFTLSLIDTKQELKAVGPALSEADILFMFRKDDPDQQKLADAVDVAIKELKADGTLGKLSSEWLGEDFTSEEK